MTIFTLLTKTKIQKIGKVPVVVLPIKIWQYFEEQLEELEMVRSQSLRKKIAKARLEKKLYSTSEVRKALRI